MSDDFPPLPNIDFLIDGNGAFTIGTIASIPCVAAAADDERCLAMLVRREGETLKQLLIRLDRAIEMAEEEDVFIDEVNEGRDDRV